VRSVRVLLVILLAFLCSCDVDLFGLDQKQIAKGYRLCRVEGRPEGETFALLLPREDGGTVIDEIGWSEPLVIVRYGDKWDVYDTTTNKEISISDSDRKQNSKFRDIPSFFRHWRGKDYRIIAINGERFVICEF
jgi:hypothetical protein